jgi:hypothetical protein
MGVFLGTKWFKNFKGDFIRANKILVTHITTPILKFKLIWDEQEKIYPVKEKKLIEKIKKNNLKKIKENPKNLFLLSISLKIVLTNPSKKVFTIFIRLAVKKILLRGKTTQKIIKSQTIFIATEKESNELNNPVKRIFYCFIVSKKF